MLEFGAGRGRLIEALVAVPSEATARLHYHAYNDPEFSDADERAACQRQLDELEHGYGCEDLRALQLDTATKVHAVVLCNVLHEIPPGQWTTLMATLADCLREDGTLLIFEDQQMSVGELPHDAGYLVLDRIELCALFQLDPGGDALGYHEQRGRLSVAEVPASALRACSQARVGVALEQLRVRALRQLQSLRGRGTASSGLSPHQRGRLHAYYAMLHTNATIARSEG